MHAPFNGLGPDVELRNGRIVGGSRLFYENGNGYQDGLYPNYEFDNITVYDVGDSGGDLFGSLNVTNSTFRNITRTALAGASGENGSVLPLKANWRARSAWDTPQAIAFSDIEHESEHFFIARVSIHPQAAGVDYRISNSRFNNSTNTLYRTPDGTGRLSSLEGDHSKLRVYMEDTEFNLYGSYTNNLETFFALTRFRNCTDARSGRTSEDGGTVTYTAEGGENYIDVPTNLMWEPQSPEFTTVAGALYTSHEYVSTEGTPLEGDRRGPTLRLHLTRALNANEPVSFDWSAAVRPWDENPWNETP